MKLMTYGWGVMLAVLALAASANAGNTFPTPEISAGSVSAALGLLSAGILVLRARRRK